MKRESIEFPLPIRTNKKISVLIMIFISIFFQSCDNSNEIYQAVNSGDTKKVKEIITTRPRMLMAQDSRGRTPLHEAVRRGNQDMVKLLLDNGASPNVVDKEGMAPLHIAAVMGFKDLGELLVSRRAIINRQDRKGWTPLHYAVQDGYISFVIFLIEKGADGNIKNSDNKTPLQLAEESGKQRIVDIIKRNKQE